MHRTLTTAAFAFLLSVLADSAFGQDTSVDDGRKFALAVCSACHVVASDQEFPPQLNQHAPDFQEIADRPNTTAISLRRFIGMTHWDLQTVPMTMPDFALTDKQKDDAIRYILSLRKH